MRSLVCLLATAALLVRSEPASCQDVALAGDASQLLHQGTEGVRGQPEDGDAFGDALVWGDFNGDGILDLAVGVPGEDIGDIRDAGAVNIFYGGANLELTNAGVQEFDQGNNALKGRAEAGDRFGAALAAGDLNGDGYDDLAIGVPGESVGNVMEAGAVAILFGTQNGLLATDNLLLYEGLSSFAPDRRAGERHHFGAALSVGDFYGNGKPRLVIGIPGARVEGKTEAGAFAFLFPTTGGGWGLARVLHQGYGRVKGQPEAGDQFGASFAAGDFDGNGRDDLAVGAPGESVGELGEAGAVTVFFGSQDGILETSSNLVFNQNGYGIEDEAESGDLFGWSLSSGDFDGDGYDDLAIGVPGEDLDDLTDAGAVSVLYGHEYSSRLGERNQFWHQNAISMAEQTARTDVGDRLSKRVPRRVPTKRVEPSVKKVPSPTYKPLMKQTPIDPAERHDGFGTSVAAADFDLDGMDDLAVGVPREDAPDVNTIEGTGMEVGIVQVLYGSGGNGLSAARSQLFSQESEGIQGRAESGDRFGMVLAAADLRLAVGVPSEAVGSRDDAGAVNVIYSGALK